MDKVEKIKAEIERRKLLADKQKDNTYFFARSDAYAELLNFIDTLEVKEVDLEKELKLLDNTLFDLDGVAVQGATHYLTVEDVKDIARHFFELGLKAQKGE